MIERPLNELTGYTALGNYEQFGVDGIVALLRRNRCSLDIDPDSRSTTESIRSEYESSLEELSELNGEISAAEPELESAVFDLYEMTESQRNTIDVEYES